MRSFQAIRSEVGDDAFTMMHGVNIETNITMSGNISNHWADRGDGVSLELDKDNCALYGGCPVYTASGNHKIIITDNTIETDTDNLANNTAQGKEAKAVGVAVELAGGLTKGTVSGNIDISNNRIPQKMGIESC